MIKVVLFILFLASACAAQLTTIVKDDTMELQLDKGSIIRSKTTVLFTTRITKTQGTMNTIFMVECARQRYVMLGHYGKVEGEEIMFPDGKNIYTFEESKGLPMEKVIDAVCKPDIQDVIKGVRKELEAGDGGAARRAPGGRGSSDP